MEQMSSVALRFYLQAEARRLLPQHRVGQCLRAVVPGEKLIEVWRETRRNRAHYKHLRTCGSIWVCPVCASKISEERRIEIRRVIEAVKLKPILMLYTMEHHAGDSLAITVETLLSMYALHTSGKGWEDIKNDYNIFGWVRSLEFTHGSNGWHPHLHVIQWGDTCQIDMMREDIGNRWRGRLEKLGLKYVDGISFNLVEADREVGDYVSKMGVHEVKWGADHELAKSAVKKAKKGHRNPIQLLYDSSCGDRAASALFREYAAFSAGRRQLEWSRKPDLKKIAGVTDVTDGELVDRHTDSEVLLAELTISQWHKVLHVGGVGDLLDMAANGNISEFYAWLYDICRYAPIHNLT